MCAFNKKVNTQEQLIILDTIHYVLDTKLLCLDTTKSLFIEFINFESIYSLYIDVDEICSNLGCLENFNRYSSGLKGGGSNISRGTSQLWKEQEPCPQLVLLQR